LSDAPAVVALDRSISEKQQDQLVAARPGLISGRRLGQIGFSLIDQALSVGGIFIANVVLARAQTKEEYGMFALSYSIYTFLLGMNNAMILEPFTVYGAGRYHRSLRSYAQLMWRSNLLLIFGLSVVLMLAWAILHWTAHALASPALLGLALSIPFLLAGQFVRRGFYIEKMPSAAAGFSAIFFMIIAVLLFAFMRFGLLDSFSTFIIAALAWATAGILYWKWLPGRSGTGNFLTEEPDYWREHWKYARWVVATALVFQLMTQGYYWLLAIFLSVREVAEFRAMHILTTPMDQALTAATLVILPLMAFRYASGQSRSLIHLWHKYTLAAIAATGLFSLCVYFFSLRILHLIYGGKFDGLAHLLGTMAALPVLMALGNTANVALKAIEKPDFVFYGYLASGVVTFLGGVPLVIHFGLPGAVYGMLLSTFAYALTLSAGFLFLVRRQIPNPMLASTLETGPKGPTHA